LFHPVIGNCRLFFSRRELFQGVMHRFSPWDTGSSGFFPLFHTGTPPLPEYNRTVGVRYFPPPPPEWEWRFFFPRVKPPGDLFSSDLFELSPDDSFFPLSGLGPHSPENLLGPPTGTFFPDPPSPFFRRGLFSGSGSLHKHDEHWHVPLAPLPLPGKSFFPPSGRLPRFLRRAFFVFLPGLFRLPTSRKGIVPGQVNLYPLGCGFFLWPFFLHVPSVRS